MRWSPSVGSSESGVLALCGLGFGQLVPFASFLSAGNGYDPPEAILVKEEIEDISSRSLSERSSADDDSPPSKDQSRSEDGG